MREIVTRAEPSRRKLRLRKLICGIFALAAFAILFFWLAGISRLDLDAPLAYEGDALEMQAYYEHDYINNDADTRLHAPFELDHAQNGRYIVNALFQSNSNLIWLSWLAARGNDVRALNYAYIATYLLAFLSAYWVCGRLGVGNPFRFCAASLFALMPYHFGRGISHFWESSYYLTPLLALVLIRLWSARPLAHVWRTDGWKFSWRDPAAIWSCVLLVFFSSFHPYHQFFFACLAMACAPFAALYRRSWRPFVIGVALAAIALGVLVVKNAFLHFLHTPELALSNNGQSIGAYGGAESYPLKLAQMILPVQDHRWRPFALLRAVYDAANPLNNENATTTLGMIGAIGLSACLAFALLPAAKVRPNRRAAVGLIVLIAVLLGMMGGLSSLISTASLVVFGPNFELTQMRGWNRIVIFIAFFSYVVAFALLGRGLRALQQRYLSAIPRTFLIWPSAALVLAFALWDAVPHAIGQESAEKYRSDKVFFSRIESELPDGARVMQLPYLIHHASASLEGVYYTDALRPYLSTKNLHFTYGGDIQSDQARWLKEVAEMVPDNAAQRLCNYSFSGVLLQRNMMKDAALTEQRWSATLGAQPLRSPDATYSFFDLRPYCANHHVETIDLTAAKQNLMALHVNRTHVIYAAGEPRQIGHVESGPGNEEWVSATNEESGFLSFGPEENLNPGRYVAAFVLSAAGDGPGFVTLDVASETDGREGSQRILARREMHGSTDGFTSIKLSFEVAPGMIKLQYRIYKPAGYTMRFGRVEIAGPT